MAKIKPFDPTTVSMGWVPLNAKLKTMKSEADLLALMEHIKTRRPCHLTPLKRVYQRFVVLRRARELREMALWVQEHQ